MTYPIQPGKIQAPALRDETLARLRLLDWLDVKIHSRVVLIIADAGYGKTTLLADFSRRTRVRTIWYRIDEEDRDWVGFLAHLVSAGREFDAEFAPRTAGILRSLEPGGPTREDAIETFLEELPALVADGAALILDDFHLADEVADIRLIAREIVARGPERLSIVFASRRPPSVPVAKLRSLGELAELGINDLRFSDAEMEQLFRETFGRPLEPDVLSELAQRTEGWAASLTLVQAALRERTPAETRSFVRGLSGARDELHDYLAEEVVGELPEIQQQFLMRTAILQRVTPELAQVATGLSAIEVQSMVTEAERLGMLGRRANRRSTEQRYHPLVREFLEDRLGRELGPAGVDDLHVAVARWAEALDWRTAAHHYSASLRWPDLQRVLETHLQTIVASGAFSAAADYVRLFPEPPHSAAIEVVLSREATIEGDIERVAGHARRAFELEPGNDMAVSSVISSMIMTGELSAASAAAHTFAITARSSLMRKVAEATSLILACSVDADLSGAATFFEKFAERCRAEGLAHFEGVTWLNLANVYRAQGNFDKAYAAASSALDVLSVSSSGNEMAAARMVLASILAYRGDLASARETFVEAGRALRHSSRSEYLVELADMEALLGDAGAADVLVAEATQFEVRPTKDAERIIEALLLTRHGADQSAIEVVESLVLGLPSANAGYQSRARATRAFVMTVARDPRALEEARSAQAIARKQGAALWHELANLVVGVLSGQISAAIISVPSNLHCVVSFAAELVADRLGQVDAEAIRVIAEEAHLRPQRWLPSLRRVAGAASGEGRIPAARLLDRVGEADDVPFLRSLARASRAGSLDRRLGKSLARRLAPMAVVEDLGRVRIRIGTTEVGSQDVRRKVLSLLCFLLTKPRFSATREEVMEAMWPDIDPASATNSLNQSVYFLRRIFEPEYSEDLSAGYVHQDSDLLWLDDELIVSVSRSVASLVADHEREPSLEGAIAISDRYSGKFALDFMYDDWATDFRDWLHVAYLRVIETQVRAAMNIGRFEIGIQLARKALELDTRHEELELLLVRLLRNSGSHSAAAEQYARYADFMRQDLGIEPPSLDSV